MTSLNGRLGRCISVSLVAAGLGAVACSSGGPGARPESETGATATVAEAVTGASCQALDVATKLNSTYAIDTRNEVWGWGANPPPYFPLGKSLNESASFGQKVTTPQDLGLGRAKQIAAGPDGACALLNDGTVTCWGRELGGEDPPNLANKKYLPRVVKTLDPTDGQTELTLTGITAITYGDYHACALRGSDHTVWCWGSDRSGQLGDGDSGFVGQVNDTAVQMVNVPNATQVIAAGDTTCVLHTLAGGAGEVLCAGNNAGGQLGLGGGPDLIAHPVPMPVNVTAGVSFAQLFGGGTGTGSSGAAVNGGTFCASTTKVNNAQETYCWGINDRGQAVVSNTAGTTAPFKLSQNTPIGTDVDSFWAQGFHNGCEVNAAGNVSCWGMDNNGQIPDYHVTTTNDVLAPTQVTALSGAFKVAIGQEHACALTGKTLSCWGNDNDGEVGNGSTSSPAVVSPIRLSVPPLSCGNNYGQIGAACGTLSNSCSETIDCGGCAAMNKCDPGSHTCVDDPSQCSQACGGAGAYCASHTCQNYCGTNPVANGQVGVSAWIGTGRFDASSPPGYGSGNCQDQFIIETGSNDYHSARMVTARPTAQISQADCSSTAVMLTTYTGGQQVATTGWVQAKWFTTGFGNYCGFDVTCTNSYCPGNNSITLPGGSSVARVAVAASHGSFVKGTWSGSPIPVTATIPEILR